MVGRTNVADLANRNLAIDPRVVTPAFGHKVELMMPDMIPLRRAGRKVRDADAETAAIGEPLQLGPPVSRSRTFTDAIDRDE